MFYSYFFTVLFLTLAAAEGAGCSLSNCVHGRLVRAGVAGGSSLSFATDRRKRKTAFHFWIAFGFHSLAGLKFLFPVASCLRATPTHSLLALPVPRLGRALRTQPGPGPGAVPGSGPPPAVRSRPRHDGGREEEPAVLQAVHREEPEPRVHPRQHDGLAVRR